MRCEAVINTKQKKSTITYRKNSLTLSQYEIPTAEPQVKATTNMRGQTWFGNDKQLGHVSPEGNNKQCNCRIEELRLLDTDSTIGFCKTGFSQTQLYFLSVPVDNFVK